MINKKEFIVCPVHGKHSEFISFTHDYSSGGVTLPEVVRTFCLKCFSEMLAKQVPVLKLETEYVEETNGKDNR